MQTQPTDLPLLLWTFYPKLGNCFAGLWTMSLSCHQLYLHRHQAPPWMMKVSLGSHSTSTMAYTHPSRPLHHGNEVNPQHTFHYNITSRLALSRGYFHSLVLNFCNEDCKAFYITVARRLSHPGLWSIDKRLRWWNWGSGCQRDRMCGSWHFAPVI